MSGKNLTLKITTQNGYPPVAKERKMQHTLWLDYCNSLEAELGNCGPANVEEYEKRLSKFHEENIVFPTTVYRRWPMNRQQFKHLATELGTNTFAIEVTDDELLMVAYVHD